MTDTKPDTNTEDITDAEDKPTPVDEETTDPYVGRLRDGIEQTRADMSATIGELETRLNPAEVRKNVGAELDHVEERVRAVVRDQLDDAKTLVRAELAEAKTLLRAEMNEAEEKIKRGLGEARDTVKQDVKDALTGAKRAVRAATLGQVEDLATSIGDKMNEAKETLVDTVRNNPIPAAFVGVGLAWLLMNRSQRAKNSGGDVSGKSNGHDSDRVSHAVTTAGRAVQTATHQAGDAAARGIQGVKDAAGSVAHGVSGTAMAVAHGAGDAVSEIADQASHAASSVAEGAKKGARRVEQGFQHHLHENPAALGIAAVAVGALVGFSLPRTQREDSVMGEMRDRLLHQVGDAAHDAATSASGFAEHALETIKKPTQDEVGVTE